MAKYDRQSGKRTTAFGKHWIVVLYAIGLCACGRAPDNPMPPKAPPKPRMMPQSQSEAVVVKRALYSYQLPASQADQGDAQRMPPRHAIRT
jgi:hypothetical protein